MKYYFTGFGTCMICALLLCCMGNAAEIVEVYHNPSSALIKDLVRIAETSGYRLEINNDLSAAYLINGQYEQPLPVLGSASVLLDKTPVWNSADVYAVGGLRWLDADDDGDLDLVSAHYEGGFPARPEQTRIWFNTGTMLETTSSWVSTDEVWSTDVVVGDINRDGNPDLLVVNSGSNKIHFYSGTSIETTPSWTSSESFFSLAGCLGDVTNSTYLDPAIVNQSSRPNHLYGNSTGIPAPGATWTSSDSANHTGCALGDYNEDGVTTLAVTESGDGSRSVFRLPVVPVHSVIQITVDGVPTAAYTIHYRDGWIVFHAPPGAGTDNIVFTLELSNDLDLGVSVNGGNAKVYHDTGTTLELLPSYSVGGTGTPNNKGVAWVDVDTDGDLDLFIGGNNIASHIYKNNAGVLDTTPSWSSDDTGPKCADIDWVDVDKDGDPDLAMASGTTSADVLRVYENIGGTLETTNSWGIGYGGSGPQAVAWGDMDADGCPDLAVAYSGASIQVYRNLLCDMSPTPTPTGGIPTVTPTLSPTIINTFTPKNTPTSRPTNTKSLILTPSHTLTPPDIPVTGTRGPLVYIAVFCTLIFIFKCRA